MSNQLVSVRKEISLKGGDPLYLLNKLEEFVKECYASDYLGFGSKAFRDMSYTIKGNVMYLEGSRPLLASEVASVAQGLFDD